MCCTMFAPNWNPLENIICGLWNQSRSDRHCVFSMSFHWQFTHLFIYICYVPYKNSDGHLMGNMTVIAEKIWQRSERSFYHFLKSLVFLLFVEISLIKALTWFKSLSSSSANFNATFLLRRSFCYKLAKRFFVNFT